MVDLFINKMKKMSEPEIESAFQSLENLDIDIHELIKSLFNTFFLEFLPYDVSIEIKTVLIYLAGDSNFHELRKRGIYYYVQSWICVF